MNKKSAYKKINIDEKNDIIEFETKKSTVEQEMVSILLQYQ